MAADTHLQPKPPITDQYKYFHHPDVAFDRVNTPGLECGRGKSDGTLRGWIDGMLAFEKTDIRFRDSGTLKIEEVWCNV